jgi:hypothetical protein
VYQMPCRVSTHAVSQWHTAHSVLERPAECEKLVIG